MGLGALRAQREPGDAEAAPCEAQHPMAWAEQHGPFWVDEVLLLSCCVFLWFSSSFE